MSAMGRKPPIESVDLETPTINSKEVCDVTWTPCITPSREALEKELAYFVALVKNLAAENLHLKDVLEATPWKGVQTITGSALHDIDMATCVNGGVNGTNHSDNGHLHFDSENGIRPIDLLGEQMEPLKLDDNFSTKKGVSEEQELSQHTPKSVSDKEDVVAPNTSLKSTASVGSSNRMFHKTSTSLTLGSKTSNKRLNLKKRKEDSVKNSLDLYAGGLVRHRYFDRAVSVVILANVAFMGWAANHERQNTDVIDDVVSPIPEFLFCVLYVAEIVLKVIAFRTDFFKEPHGTWNAFDLALMLQSVYESVGSLSGLTTTGNVSFLRMLRVFKMLKMLRVIKFMRSMFELRMILSAMLGSVKSMAWSITLLTSVMYMFALVFVTAATSHLKSDNDIPEDVRTAMDSYFGNIGQAMASLFEACTSGVSWRLVAQPLLKIWWVYYVIFCFYIAFFVFVILNTITALFVEATMANASKDYQETIHAEMNKKNEYARDVEMIFHELDEVGNGVITWEMFKNNIEDPQLLAFASSLGITVSDTEHFFKLLTDGGAEELDIDSFVQGCIRIKGYALSIDVQDAMMKIARCNKGIQEVKTGLNHVMHEMRALESRVVRQVLALTNLDSPQDASRKMNVDEHVGLVGRDTLPHPIVLNLEADPGIDTPCDGHNFSLLEGNRQGRVRI